MLFLNLHITWTHTSFDGQCCVICIIIACLELLKQIRGVVGPICA